MARIIRVDLTPDGIDQALTELRKFKFDFLKACNQMIEKLVIEGIGQAKMHIMAYGAMDTGELVNSVDGFFNPGTRKGIVYANAGYAAFVEYGTGVVGAGASHPDARKDGWAYDVNNHGEKGWVYHSDRDGNFHWTMGMPSRPFMYATAQRLRDKAPGFAEDLFRGL